MVDGLVRCKVRVATLQHNLGVNQQNSNFALQVFSEPTAVRNYLKLMHEVVARLELIAQACNGELRLTAPYAYEYCYFQFRRICELLALGSLQLYGDLHDGKTNAVAKEWHAERIMHRLHAMHPHAFPQSVVVTETASGWSYVANSKTNAMTYAEFKSLYNKCGQVLHRGTVRSIEAEKPLQQSDYEQAIRWSDKIVNLLDQHFISRADGEGLYLVSLKTESGGPACSVLTGFSAGSVVVATYHTAIAASDSDPPTPA